MAQAEAILEGMNLGRDGGPVVFGVKNIDATTHYQFAAQALDAAGLPQLNDPHPTLPNLFVIAEPRITDVRGNFGAAVTVEYAKRETPAGGGAFLTEPTIEIGSVAQLVTTGKDVQGDHIKVVYNPAGNPTFPDGNRSAGDFIQGGEVDQYLPLTTLRFSRIELGPPYFKAEKFVGTTNSTDFAETGDQEAWLCSRINGFLFRRASNPSNPNEYQVDYEFIRNRDGWLGVAVYIEPETGKPPGDLSNFALEPEPPLLQIGLNVAQKLFNGKTLARVQYARNFAELQLPRP